VSANLSGMTVAQWDRMTEAQRAQMRDLSGLSPQLKGLEGYRVEVTDEEGEAPRRFIVGRSTGWRPCHLEIASRRSSGGGAARGRYATVRTLYNARAGR